MLGKNLLWVAKHHGHTVEVMLRMYAAWLDGAAADIQAIKRAMERRPAARVAFSVILKGALLLKTIGLSTALKPIPTPTPPHSVYPKESRDHPSLWPSFSQPLFSVSSDLFNTSVASAIKIGAPESGHRSLAGWGR